MKYYFYVYTKSGQFYKTGMEIPTWQTGHDNKTAISKALSSFVKKVAGNDLHIHAFVSLYDYYNKVDKLESGGVKYYKRDGGRFAENPSNLQNCGTSIAWKNFKDALAEALSWTPATYAEIQKHQDQILAKDGLQLIDGQGRIKIGYPIHGRTAKTIHYRSARTKKAKDKSNQGLNVEQQKALEVLMNGKNVFLTGGAGTGKTYLLHKFLSQSYNKSVIVCAPTGVAALNAGGATLHRTFGIPVKCLSPDEDLGQISGSLLLADIIVIDEISMCRIDVFDFVMRKIQAAEKKSHKHKQVVVIGDFYQLPPVVLSRKKGDKYSDKELLTDYYGSDAAEGFAFLSPQWGKMNFETVTLTTIVRQKDKKFSKALNLVREGNSSKLNWISTHSAANPTSGAITLCSRNKDAQKINDECLRKLPGEAESYWTKFIDKENITPADKPVPDVLMLKRGCRVMLLVNDTTNPEPLYSNGSFGTIVDLEQKYNDQRIITIKLDTGHTVSVSPYSWDIERYVVTDFYGKKTVRKETVATIIQYPLKLAYAVTIHKSQGQTYDSVIVQPGRCFTNGQLYVALSRVKSISNLYLSGKLLEKQLMYSPTVKAFYENSLTLSTTNNPPARTVPTVPAVVKTVNTDCATIGKPEKVSIVDDYLDIKSRYDRSSDAVKKAFLQILQSISHCNVDSNWQDVYVNMSSSKQKIVAAALQ